MNVALKNMNNQNPPPPQNIPPSQNVGVEKPIAAEVPVEVPPLPPAAIDFNRIETAVKMNLLSKEDFIKEAEKMNLLPQKAGNLYDFIKKKL
jgi:hypothetical protein